MSATDIMLLAVVLYVIHRWATPGQSAVTVKVVVGGAFSILIVAMLDQGQTEEIAKGFAWLFLAGAAYKAIPSIASAAQKQKTPVTPKPVTAV